MHQSTSLEARTMIRICVLPFQLQINCADLSGTFAGSFFTGCRRGHCIPGDLFFFEYLARKWARIATFIQDQRYGLLGI
jgi:hypothetical protein